jgi:ComF family protein
MQSIRAIQRQIKVMAQRGLDLIFPPQCACCRAEMEEAKRPIDLCEDCQKRLIPRVWTPCARCGGQIDGQAVRPQGCSSCAASKFHFDSVTVLGGYHSSLREIVLRMKKSPHIALAHAMGQLLVVQRCEILQKHRPEVVIPIPMFWRERISRGMNSPEHIASSIGNALEIPVSRWVLRQCRPMDRQSELTPQKRWCNVKGAFCVRFASRVRGRRVLLVDDVLTTGATCSEAAKVLKRAGAASVAVAVVARTQMENRG